MRLRPRPSPLTLRGWKNGRDRISSPWQPASSSWPCQAAPWTEYPPRGTEAPWTLCTTSPTSATSADDKSTTTTSTTSDLRPHAVLPLTAYMTPFPCPHSLFLFLLFRVQSFRVVPIPLLSLLQQKASQ